jgi:hypothetical protein
MQRPTLASVDGLRLDRFELGFLYDVGTTLGMLLLSEQWAEPVIDDEPALLVPLRDTAPFSDRKRIDIASNLVREKHPYTDCRGVAVDFERRKRSSRRGR